MLCLLKNSNGQRDCRSGARRGNQETAEILQRLNTSPTGLSEEEAAERLEVFGPNEVAQEKQHGWLRRLWVAVRNPLVILLTILAIITFATAEASSDYDRRLGDGGDGGAGRVAAVHPGNQGRQRRGQTQGDDQGHRHGRCATASRRKFRSRNSCPATW